MRHHGKPFPRPGFVILASVAMLLGGCRDYQDTSRDKVALQKLCDPVRDVPAAIEAHRKAHGSYPLSLADLDLSLPLSSAAIEKMNAADDFTYSSAGDSYSIYKKLNWDGGVSYQSMSPGWRYSMSEDKEFEVY
ncbi:hypothetical protein OKA04_09840 [Luteolibacter flavescens]|uniref:Lipoprotein n=1 Tax=Luteolibacter flavescens TaxID=1859460 RepID=A0ABT3FN85_9BACT|nr:hypothetical protein [Luteolibacter flavescens]MCW1885028.1 hypothetical protein [Luteolibacter flavescens]